MKYDVILHIYRLDYHLRDFDFFKIKNAFQDLDERHNTIITCFKIILVLSIL